MLAESAGKLRLNVRRDYLTFAGSSREGQWERRSRLPQRDRSRFARSCFGTLASRLVRKSSLIFYLPAAPSCGQPNRWRQSMDLSALSGAPRRSVSQPRKSPRLLRKGGQAPIEDHGRHKHPCSRRCRRRSRPVEIGGGSAPWRRSRCGDAADPLRIRLGAQTRVRAAIVPATRRLIDSASVRADRPAVDAGLAVFEAGDFAGGSVVRARVASLPLAQLCIAWVTALPVAVRAPSTTYCAPVIADARSEQRNSTVLAISSGMT